MIVVTLVAVACAYLYGVRVGIRGTKQRAYEAGKTDAYAEVMF